MRDPKRIVPMLELLRKAWERYPDMRLGQLVDNIFHSSGGNQFYREDSDVWNDLELWANGEKP